MDEKILDCGCHKIDTYGNIFSCCEKKSLGLGKRGFKICKSDHWHKIKPGHDTDGYPQIVLHSKCFKIHRLIAASFIPNPLNLPQVQHKDGNNKNNKITNLKWGTAKDNSNDRRNHGRTADGEKNGFSKLTVNQVKEIRALLKTTTMTTREIGKKYNVVHQLISRIGTRGVWKCIPD